MRGLKLDSMSPYYLDRIVAPYVGAWIETVINALNNGVFEVAPYVGAWIETD